MPVVERLLKEGAEVNELEYIVDRLLKEGAKVSKRGFLRGSGLETWSEDKILTLPTGKNERRTDREIIYRNDNKTPKRTRRGDPPVRP